MYKIAMVTSQWTGKPIGGGIGRPTAALAESLLALGHDVRVIFARNPAKPPDLAKQLEGSLSWSKITKTGVNNTYPRYLETEWRVSQEIHDFNPDLVICQDWQGLASIFSTQGQRPPLVSWLHGGTAYDYHGKNVYFEDPFVAMMSELERIQIESSDFVISPSQFLLDLYSRDYEYRIGNSLVIPYHFPSKEEGSGFKKDATPNLVFVGRLSARKGFSDFISLCREAYQNLGTISVQIAGESIDFDGELEAQALRKTGIQATYLGIARPEKVWKAVRERNSALLVTSSLDNSPNIVYEAISNQVPTLIVGDRNGARELVTYSALVHCFEQGEKIDWAQFFSASNSAETFASDRINAQIVSEWESLIEKTIQLRRARRRVLVRSDASPKISVIIPTHNRREFLLRALRSIAMQDSLPHEVVVVDDASPADYLGEILSRDWPFRVKTIRNPRVMGPGASRNLGVKASVGEIIAFIDDDNEWNRDHLSLSVSTLLGGADIAVAQLSGRRKNAKHPIDIVFLGSSGASISDFDNLVGDTSFCCKREVFETVDGFQESEKMTNEDFVFLLKAVRLGLRVETLPRTTVRYRLNTDGVDSRHRHSFMSLYKRDFPYGLVGRSLVRHLNLSRHFQPTQINTVVALITRLLAPWPRGYSFAAKLYRNIRAN